MIRRAPPPSFEGDGQFRIAARSGPAHYTIEGDPARLRPGPLRLRGAITLTPELAEEAFRHGEGVLTTADGLVLRATMLGHTEGAATVFVELKC